MGERPRSKSSRGLDLFLVRGTADGGETPCTEGHAKEELDLPDPRVGNVCVGGGGLDHSGVDPVEGAEVEHQSLLGEASIRHAEECWSACKDEEAEADDPAHGEEDREGRGNWAGRARRRIQFRWHLYL